ncbi:hypothetical protein KUTeg_014384 [Tegillarca granosa]|uniref:Tox-ART-HYD1 domain-containing protein n=1 Tax=Tegillarca granosa TaxID=220873 RepID=A0ABQ9F1N8_TEGGR|nr:hypothetical protein KUTeg_014384 [Tegillarca granosa]
MNSDLKTLVHYTNFEGIQGILTSGVIAPSTDTKNDAIFGPGVYANTYGPENSKTMIAKNNYGNAWGPYMMQGKVNYGLEFKVPANMVVQAPVSDRDVWIHKTPVVLNEAQSVKNHVLHSSGKYSTFV